MLRSLTSTKSSSHYTERGSIFLILPGICTFEIAFNPAQAKTNFSTMQGRPSKKIEVKVNELLYIGKRGIQIKVTHKRARSKTGIFYLTVGGLWWREHEKKNWKKVSWDELVEMFMER